MKKSNTLLYQFAYHFIKYFSVLLCVLLFICGFFFTTYAEDMSSQQMLTCVDNPLISILGALLLSAFLYLSCKWVNQAPIQRKRILLCIVFLWYMAAGIILVLFSKTVPAGDTMSVYSVAEQLALGNTGVIHPTDSYLSYYPQQMGLVGYYELIIRLWNLVPVDLHAYHIIKCINVFWACIIIFFQYKAVQLLFKSHTADTLYLLLSLLHFPLLLYTSYVYGEVPSFALFSVGAWALLRLLSGADTLTRRQNVALVLLSILAFCLSVALRKNALILIIAAVIVTLLEALRKKSGKLLLLAVLYMVLSLLTLPCVQSFYEFRAGSTLSSGVPALSYFAMGMQEGGRGPGWYNGFNFDTYHDTGLDTELTNEISSASIADRLTLFGEDPLYACDFYAGKFLTQWADGTYASLQATLATFGGRRSFFQELYEGKYSSLFRGYCNILQNQIYLGILFFAVGALKKKTSASQGLPLYLFMIGVVGGFLFHLIWEANSRYIFAYGLLLLPYAACGISTLLTRCPFSHIRSVQGSEADPQ